MRNISLYIVLALAAAALASCTKAPAPVGGGFPEDGIVRISTTVSAPETKAPGTRADAAVTYEGSTLGLFLDYGDGQKYTQSNVLWSNDGSNNWSAAAPMLWKDASTKLDVYAYAPYVAGEGSPSEVKFTIPLDQSEGLDAADLLWCPMQGFDPATGLTDKKLNIEFKHALVKLTVNIILGTEFKGKDISIREALFRGSVDKAAIFFRETPSVVGVASSVSANAVSIKMHDCSADGKLACEVIFYPHSFDRKEMLTFTLSDGKDYRLTPASGFDDRFKLGNAYNMNVKVGNDKVEIVSVAIADWDGSSNVGGENTDFEASKSPMPVDISDLRTELKAWNDAHSGFEKSLADMITPALLDDCCVDGKLILTGEFDNTNELCLGMSEETIEAFAVIAAYVRDNDVTCLDMSGLKGVKQLISISPAVSGKAEEYNLRFSSVVREYDGSGNVTESGEGSKLVTFIGSGDLLNITSAFEKCADLTSVSGFDNVTHADFAFANCSKLTKTPDLPKVVSLNHTFDYTAIAELNYKTVQEIAVTNCSRLTSIDCPKAVKLGQYAFAALPKLEAICLSAGSFESVHWQVFDGLKGGQVQLILGESQKANINTTDETWTPKDSKGNSVVVGNSPASLELFKAVYCGTEKIL